MSTTALAQQALPEDATITKALREFDAALPPLKPGQEPITLNVVGGYALIAREIRTDQGQLTDIDHVGQALPAEWLEQADRIGIENRLGRGWINNDLMLSGTSLQDLQYATGPLEFEPFESDLAHFRVNIATEKTLRRMKVIAIDTALTAVELGGDFTRARDLEDITRFENASPGSIKQTLRELENEYLLLDAETTGKAVNLAASGKTPDQVLAAVGIGMDGSRLRTPFDVDFGEDDGFGHQDEDDFDHDY